MRVMLALLLLIVAAPAQADRRIEMHDYSPSRIYTVAGQRAIQTMIEFGEDEHIENIALGDAAAWQVTPNKQANLIFVKPLFARSNTNMTVVTDKRRYLFELVNAGQRARGTYLIRFVYPEDMLAAAIVEKSAVAAMERPVAAEAAVPAAVGLPPAPLPVLNSNWKFTGDKNLNPARIYDDGIATFIAWSASHELPGIFINGNDGSEGAVNFTVSGDFLVIDGVAPRYVLRMGKARAVLTNMAPRAPQPVAAMPAASKGNP